MQLTAKTRNNCCLIILSNKKYHSLTSKEGF